MRLLIFALALWMGFGSASPAQTPVPLTDEFQINTYTTDSQGLPVVRSDGAGGFFVVWYSDGSSEDDTSFNSIQAQRFARDGSTIGTQFQVNTCTSNSQNFPAIGSDGADGFVVAWRSYGSPGTDSVPPISGFSVQARRFEADGSPVGAQFQVNTFTPSNQGSPDVGPDGSGGFVVVWGSYGSSGTDTSGSSMQAQRYAADGTPKGQEFQVNTSTIGSQSGGVLSPDSAGGFVVVWPSFESVETEILGQRFDSNGLKIGSEFQVNTRPTGFLPDIAVVPNGDDGFVVAWREDPSVDPPEPPPGPDPYPPWRQARPSGDPEARSIQVRRFDSVGSPIGEPVRVNTSTSDGALLNPSIGQDGTDGFVVAWQHRPSPVPPYISQIRAQHFAADATPLGDEFLVHAHTTQSQRVPVVSSTAAGRFIVVWDSEGASGTDTSSSSVQGRRYVVPGIFSDGFESGDTSAWTQSNGRLAMR